MTVVWDETDQIMLPPAHNNMWCHLANSQQSGLLTIKQIKSSEKPAIIIQLTPQSHSFLPLRHNSRNTERCQTGEIGHYRASVGRKTARLKWIVQPPLIIWRLAQFIFNYRQCQCLLVWSEHLLAGGCELRPGLVRSTIKILKLNLSHLWELTSI